MSCGRARIDNESSVSSGRVRIDDELSLYCEASGHGATTVLLVPGWTMSTAVFERQLEFFAGSAQYRFVTYDPRAHGESTRTAGGHYYAQHGRDLGALVERLELDGIVLGGWSWGTLESLAYVNQFGADRLAGLIMLDGPPRAAGPDNAEDWVSYRYDDADGRDAFFTMGRLTDCVDRRGVLPVPFRRFRAANANRRVFALGRLERSASTRHVLKRRQYPSMIGAIR